MRELRWGRSHRRSSRHQLVPILDNFIGQPPGYVWHWVPERSSGCGWARCPGGRVVSRHGGAGGRKQTVSATAAAVGALNRVQGNHGESFIGAVASAAGLSCSKPDLDFGFDRNVEALDGEMIRLQIKTTSAFLATQANALRFPLDIDAYDRLRRMHAVPSFLVVVEVPTAQADWTGQMASGLVFRRRALFVSLAGAGPSSNVTSVTVSLPLANMVTPRALLKLMGGGA